MTLLGGLSLLHVSRDAVHLKLVTAYPTSAVRGQDPGPCATADHELSLHLHPGSSTGAEERLAAGGARPIQAMAAAAVAVAQALQDMGPAASHAACCNTQPDCARPPACLQ